MYYATQTCFSLGDCFLLFCKQIGTKKFVCCRLFSNFYFQPDSHHNNRDCRRRRLHHTFIHSSKQCNVSMPLLTPNQDPSSLTIRSAAVHIKRNLPAHTSAYYRTHLFIGKKKAVGGGE